MQRRKSGGQSWPCSRTIAPRQMSCRVLRVLEERSWVGIKSHMRYNQGAYDAESAAPARPLKTAMRRDMTPERVTILTDAQAAIKRMASDGTGPGQIQVFQAGNHIAALRWARPDIIEIRWWPLHKHTPENQRFDEWAKLSAEEPDARRVNYPGYSDRVEASATPLPKSLLPLRREISGEKYRLQISDARWHGCGCVERLAARLYQLQTGRCLTGQYLHWTKNIPTAQCWSC